MKFETLQKDMIAAMKARDKVRKDAIATLVSAAKKAAIDAGTRDNITEEIVDKAILKEVKTAQEQYDTCPAERAELKANYETVLNIMKEYAPHLMSADEIKALLQDKYADVIASKNKGMIMKTVMADLKGKADGKVIGQVVADLLK